MPRYDSARHARVCRSGALAGAHGRELPPHLGYWHQVYVRFARWRDSGVWERVARWLVAHNRRVPHARQRQVQLDSTSIRVHQHAAGAAKKKANKPLAAAGAGAPANCS